MGSAARHDPDHGWKLRTDIADAATEPAARYRTVAYVHGQLSEAPATRSPWRIPDGCEAEPAPAIPSARALGRVGQLTGTGIRVGGPSSPVSTGQRLGCW